ncbi:DUF2345 domain-containing protein, partial [Escherichia coli]|uniref:DUF2345 domain-containing protein n=1 Tax=Escherichia coli TaxID=562 RepID=UPI001CDAE12D
MSGDNTDITAGQSFTVVAEGAVSLLSTNQGMQLLAAKGRVNIQAQSDDLSMSSQQNLDIQSSEGKVTVSA